MRTYRVGDTMGPLLWWNVILALVILVLLLAAEESRSQERTTLYAAAAAAILLGPVALTAYLARYFRVRVALGRDGVVLSERYEIPWSEVRSVERRGWRPGAWNPFERFEMTGCSWVFVILLFKVVVFILVAVLVVWFLRVVVVPVLVLYSPWHSRVVIGLADGTRLVYRDLRDAEDFVWRLSLRIGQAS